MESLLSNSSHGAAHTPTSHCAVEDDTVESGVRWDGNLVDELIGLRDVRAVFVTDGRAGVLHQAGRILLTNEMCEQIELMLAVINRTGQLLNAGTLSVHVSTFRGATFVASVSARCHACVLADPGANLGQLLGYMRCIFPSSPAQSQP